jgi:hypothetical protein
MRFFQSFLLNAIIEYTNPVPENDLFSHRFCRTDFFIFITKNGFGV